MITTSDINMHMMNNTMFEKTQMLFEPGNNIVYIVIYDGLVQGVFEKYSYAFEFMIHEKNPHTIIKELRMANNVWNWKERLSQYKTYNKGIVKMISNYYMNDTNILNLGTLEVIYMKFITSPELVAQNSNLYNTLIVKHKEFLSKNVRESKIMNEFTLYLEDIKNRIDYDNQTSVVSSKVTSPSCEPLSYTPLSYTPPVRYILRNRVIH